MSELLAEKRRLVKEGASQVVLKPEELEMKKYEEAEIDTNSFDDDPFTFSLHHYPILSMAAFDLLLTPANTTPVERIFSTGGNSTQGKRNCLTDRN